MRTINYTAGQQIIGEGEDGDTAFLIVSGSVRVLIGTQGGQREVATLNAGEVFGEMSLLEPGPRSATIVAATDVEAVETTYDEFLASMREHPEQAIVFMQTLVHRLRQSNELLAKLDPQKRGLRAMLADMQNAVKLENLDITNQGQIHPYWFW